MRLWNIFDETRDIIWGYGISLMKPDILYEVMEYLWWKQRYYMRLWSIFNETRDTIWGYGISLIKLKAKNTIFPIKTFGQALRQSVDK